MDNSSCCPAQVSLTPQPQNYPPGLSALTQRRNDYVQSLQSMIAAIPQYALGSNDFKTHPLAALTTRESDDPVIAFFDAWAVVLDVLDFYQLRILNEFYLRTAIEQRSIMELARAVGYELSPGVAASTWLIFAVDTTSGSPAAVRVPRGTQVQSIPGQKTTLQSFETQTDLTAQVELNQLFPYQPMVSVLQTITYSHQQLLLQGTTTRLQIGDAIFLIATDANNSIQKFILTLNSVEFNNQRNCTTITWNENLEKVAFPLQNLIVYRLEQMNCFGHNAPLFYSMSPDVQNNSGNWDLYPPTVWQNPNIPNNNDKTPPIYSYYKNADLYLDQTLTQVLPNNWIILRDPQVSELPAFYQVSLTHTESLAGFGLSGTLTGLVLHNPDKNINFGFRTTTIYVQSQPIALVVLQQLDPNYYPVSGNKITLDLAVNNLQIGQKLILGGIPTNRSSKVYEVLTIVGIEQDSKSGDTIMVLQDSLANSYDPSTVTIFGNVVQATHGSTTHEVLGSGNGSTANQSFTLKKPQLTYLPAATAQGIVDTLQVRVNGILWREVESLYKQPSNGQVYMVREDEESYATITFGDGIYGARLPTGTENVKATYRVGLGPDGEVAADTLSLLKVRPLGIKTVTNPLPTTGAAAPENIEAARRNAPLTVSTLERIVSLEDYGNFAQAFTGIGKAESSALREGQRPLIFITIAGENGDPVPVSSLLYTNLVQAIKAISVPGRNVVIASYEALYFNVEALLVIDARYQATTVLANAVTQLQQTFSFVKRNFAQAVAASDVIKTLQNVSGVLAVQLNAFYLSTDVKPSLQAILNALPARVDTDNVTLLPAQLLTINNIAGIDLTEMKP